MAWKLVHVCHAVFLPLPLKAEVVSQPVKAWKNSKLLAMGLPRSSQILLTWKAWRDDPVPNLIHNWKSGYLAKTSWNFSMQMVIMSVLTVCIENNCCSPQGHLWHEWKFLNQPPHVCIWALWEYFLTIPLNLALQKFACAPQICARKFLEPKNETTPLCVHLRAKNPSTLLAVLHSLEPCNVWQQHFSHVMKLIFVIFQVSTYLRLKLILHSCQIWPYYFPAIQRFLIILTSEAYESTSWYDALVVLLVG